MAFHIRIETDPLESQLCDLRRHVQHLFALVETQGEHIIKLEKTLSDLLTSEQAVEAAESALEARVTAHETNDTAVAAALQAQIDALKASNADVPTAIANLTALATHMATFDATAPVPVPTPTPATTAVQTNNA